MKSVVFIAAFCVYIVTAFPALAPYRDSGEMTSVAATLGVAHPPGYPLYVLTANIAGRIIPLGNYAYRITVLSALLMAGAAAVFFALIRKTFRLKNHVAAAMTSGFAFSYFYWYLAVVQEMYTMSVFLILCAAYLLLDGRSAAAFFMLGISAGARTDAALVYPSFILYAYFKRLSVKEFAAAHAAMVTGLSVFLYSWVRAKSGPAINWGDASTLTRLFDSLMRRSHGGTLDLISSGFAAGENFFVQMRYYAAHILRDFTPAGAAAAVVGAAYLFRRRRGLFWFAAAGFGVTGVMFMYLANMPPNTHALAILEAHFLLPDLFFCLFAAAGAGFAYSEISARVARGAVLASAGIWLVPVWIFASALPGVNKRHNFFLVDYARNVSVSTRRAVLVIKEDVQVFSMWHRRYAERKQRDDLHVVAAGLAGSPWYKKMNAGWPVALTPLKSPDDWKRFIDGNRRVFFSNDAEFPLTGAETTPAGLLNAASRASADPTAASLLDEIYVYRGDYRYENHREFFTPDIIEDYAKALHRRGFHLMTSGERKSAERWFLAALCVKEIFPPAAYHLGWCRFAENDFKGAHRYYKYAAALYERYAALADEYRAAPDVRADVRREAAGAWLHLGVTAEKLGRDEEALENYSRATDLSANFSLAYYNKAVIYWKKGDFASARSNLTRVLEIDPSNAEARRYLGILGGGRR